MRKSSIDAMIEHNQDPAAIIAAIESAPKESLSLQAALFYGRFNYAQAFGNHDWVLWKTTFQMLADRPEDSDPELNYLRGLGLTQLYHTRDAISYLKQALQEAPERKQELENLIAGCQDFMSRPRFYQSFQDRVERFWRIFQMREEMLARYIETLMANPNAPDNQSLHKAIQEVFHFALWDVHIYFALLPGKNHVMFFRPEGDEVMMLLFDYILRRRPELNLTWTWYDHPELDPPLPMAMMTGWKIWLTPQPDGRLEIQTLSNSLMASLLGGGSVKEVFVSLCKTYLGEPTFLASISNIEIVQTPPKRREDTDLAHLKQELQRRGLYFDSSRDFAERRVLRWTVPESAHPSDPKLREDAITVETRLPSLSEQFLGGRNKLMDSLIPNHIVAGFLYYPIASPIDETYRHTLEDMLRSAGEDCVTLIGHTEGSVYQYIDFLAWDFEAVMDTIEAFFTREQPVSYVLFHTFYRDADPVQVYPPLPNPKSEQSIPLPSPDRIFRDLVGKEHLFDHI